MKKYIYGFGGLGKDLYNLCKNENIKVDGFIDDNIEIKNEFNIEKFERLINKKEKFEVIIAIGDPNIKRKIDLKLKKNNIKLWSFISKFANILIDKKQIEDGVIIYPFVFIGNSSKIEENVMIGANTSIGHDTKICKFSTIAFNCSVGGGVIIGDTTYIGSGANIRDEIKVGDYVIVGMGSTIVKLIESKVKIYNDIKKVKSKNIFERIFK